MYIHDRSLYWFGTGTVIKNSGSVKHMMPCKCFPHLIYIKKANYCNHCLFLPIDLSQKDYLTPVYFEHTFVKFVRVISLIMFIRNCIFTCLCHFLEDGIAFRQLRLQLIDLEHISLIRTFRKGKETVFIFIKSIKTYSCHICSRTVSRHARYNVVKIV